MTARDNSNWLAWVSTEPNIPSPPSSDSERLQGELMLRDGPYMGESDTLMKLSGVYVPASGRLHALLEPKQAVQLPFQPHEADVASPHYR